MNHEQGDSTVVDSDEAPWKKQDPDALNEARWQRPAIERLAAYGKPVIVVNAKGLVGDFICMLLGRYERLQVIRHEEWLVSAHGPVEAVTILQHPTATVRSLNEIIDHCKTQYSSMGSIPIILTPTSASAIPPGSFGDEAMVLDLVRELS